MPAPTPNPGLNTNSGLGPGPGLIVLSPAGFVVRYNVVGWNGATGQGQWSNNQGQFVPGVVSPVVGGISTGGVGDLALSGYNITARQGVLDVTFKTGTAGTSQLVAALVDKIPTPTGYAGIFLDTENRPFCVVTDVNGTVVAQTAPQGTAVPAGSPIHAQLEWNSVGAFDGVDFVVFEVGETAIGNWATEAETPWTAFQPAWLMVGDGFSSYGPLTGTIGNVTLGNGSAPTLIPPQATQSHTLFLGIAGNSTMAAAARVNRGLSDAIAGHATVTPSLTPNRGLSDAIAGHSTVAVTLTVTGP